MLNRSSIKKNAVILDQVVYSGGSFLLTMLLTRMITPGDFGLYASFVLIIFLGLSISNALIIQPLQIGLSKFKNESDYLSFTFRVLILLVLTLAAVTSLTFNFADSFNLLSDDTLLYFLPVSILGSAWLIQDYFRKTFLATNEVVNALVLDLLLVISQISCTIGVYSFLDATLTDFIYGLSASFSISTFYGILKSNIKFTLSRRVKVYFKYHINAGSYLLLSSLLQWFSGNLFVIASGLLISVEALGAFRLVQSIFGFFNVILQTVENYIIPKVSRIHAESKTAASAYITKLSATGGVIFLVVLIPLFVFSKSAILIFGGPQYVEYHTIIKGMVFLYGIIYWSYTVRIPIRILELNDSYFLGYLLSFGSSLLLFKPLLSTFGVAGAIGGLILNQLILILVWKNKLRKHTI